MNSSSFNRWADRVIPNPRQLIVILAAGAIFGGAAAAEDSIGEHFYRTGRTMFGPPIRAILADGVFVNAEQLPCVSCHQPSGFGTTEGDKTAPPITWAALEAPRTQDLRTPYRSRSLANQARVGYDEESFAVAVRTGIDPMGRELDAAMPRYELDDGAMEFIVKHLRSLSVGDVPGVSETEIHFATIITPGVDETQRNALIDVLQKFASDKNAETRNDTGRARRGPYYKDTTQQAYRRWVIHVWDLKGPAISWRTQLDAYLVNQPVFAIAGGAVVGEWQPIGGFCEQQRIPCILPGSNLPSLASEQRYSFFFSKGLALEAELLAAHLAEHEVPVDVRIEQYFVDGTEGQLAASTTSDVLSAAGYKNLGDRVLNADGSNADSRRDTSTPHIRILWLRRAELVSFSTTGQAKAVLATYASGTLLNSAIQPAPPELGDAWILHPFEMADQIRRTTVRGRAWIAKKGITRNPDRTHLDAYLTALVIHDGVKHMRTNFSRQYFMERIEHSMDSAAYRSIYPRLSLGPGQRFASKTGHVVRFGSSLESQPAQER